MSNEDPRSRRAINDNLEAALSTIDDIVEKRGISSDARATATSFYQQTLQEHSSFIGWDIETAASACLYLACKIEHEGISAEDISKSVEGVRGKFVLRRAKQLRNELGLDFVDIVDPHQYVEQQIENLNASEEIQDRAEEIISHVFDTHITSGKKPSAVAAAAIYNASIDVDEKITQKEIAKAAGVTQVTIRNQYQEQRDFIDS